MLSHPKGIWHSSELVKSLFIFTLETHTHTHIIIFLLIITQQCMHSSSHILSLPTTLLPNVMTVTTLEFTFRELFFGNTEVQR